ncbi:MAG: hypothetical protein COU69_01010 [Candidatus Pacebacteria bacterium CG10_big_fil_rev_8_21_14_0_10_56_10]|nr:MAG: hypothetical protein COU69_01010 [Candidatus Pacebacteria bacterium CG10_big_fil_rev_8_21_14_0_10_56_10]
MTQHIAEATNTSAEEIEPDHNLVSDLLLELESDVPRLLADISKVLNVKLDPDIISTFIEDATADPNKATLTELVALLEEELEFN